jgi:hypothetical protein
MSLPTKRLKCSNHGFSRTAIYSRWFGMKKRCLDPDYPNYKRYGAIGITISDAWANSFDTFLSDMGLPPTPDHQIERKDNTKGYSKENCHWATRKENNRNRRDSRVMVVKGITMTMIAASEAFGVPYTALHMRLASGWSDEKAALTPVRFRGPNLKPRASTVSTAP